MLSSGRIDPTAPRPTQLRPLSPLRRAPPRPDRPVVCSGLGFDRYLRQFVSLNAWHARRIRKLFTFTCRIQNADISQAVRYGATHGELAQDADRIVRQEELSADQDLRTDLQDERPGG